MSSESDENSVSSSDSYVPSTSSHSNSEESDPESVRNTGEGETKSKVKKRKSVNSNMWKRNVSKRMRTEGKEYTSSRGKLIKKKEIGNDCNCRWKCFEKVSVDQRTKIFDSFYQIGSKTGQDEYLCGLITCFDIKRKRAKSGSGRPRTMSNKYKVGFVFLTKM